MTDILMQRPRFAAQNEPANSLSPNPGGQKASGKTQQSTAKDKDAAKGKPETELKRLVPASERAIRELQKWQIATGEIAADTWSSGKGKEKVLSARRKKYAKNPQRSYQIKGHKRYDTTLSLKRLITSARIPMPRKRVKLPEKVDTSITSTYQPLNVENAVQQALAGNLKLELPIMHETDVDISKQPYASISQEDIENNPQIRYNTSGFQSADILASYNVVWPIEKCVRDLLQNFADGHGGTLDGVTIEVSKEPDGAYEVYVRGKGEYSHEYLEDLGATDKKDKENNSGGFGEGAKIMSLVMLREPRGDDKHTIRMAEEMEFSSNNWAYDFDIQKDERGEDCLYRRLRIVPDKDENYLRIKTRNPDFVEGLIKGLNYFRYSLNPDYFQKTYENVYGGFTYHGPEQSGNLYIVNQRTEYETRHNWDANLPEYTFWTNIKEELRDRDRSQVSRAELKTLIDDMAKLMPDDKLLGSIFTMQDSWEGEDFDDHILLDVLVTEARERNLEAQFPEKYICYSPSLDLPNELKEHIDNKGYIMCPPELGELGMDQISRRHRLVNYKTSIGQKPHKEEVIRMNILREAGRFLVSEIPSMGKMLSRFSIDNNLLYIWGDEEHTKEELDLEKMDKPITWLDQQEFLGDFYSNLNVYIKSIIYKPKGKTLKIFNTRTTSKWEILELLKDSSANHKVRREFQILKTLWEDSVDRQKKDPKWIQAQGKGALA